MATQRTAIQGLGLSLLGFLAWASYEGWEPVAKPPIPGDVPTYGFGMTTRPDGSPAQNGDRTEPVQAIRQVISAAGAYEVALRRCMGSVELHQHEWDAFVLLAKNVGPGAVCRSSIVPKLQAGRYDEACMVILDFGGITRVINGRRVRLSCEVRANGCFGVWRARQAEYQMCSAGEYPE